MKGASVLIPFCLIALSPAMAEGYNGQAEDQSSLPAAAIGRQVSQTVTTTNGQVGQRQTREQIRPNAAPLDRIQSRITSRVQNRLRNRVDRYYDPQADATSSFDAADQQTQRAVLPRRP